MKIAIIGGVAGGASAAARFRRLDENIEIVMFERGEYISFANCGLPYHIGGTIQERENLLVQTVEDMHSRFNLDIRIKTEVQSIDPKAKTLKVKNLRNNETYEESFDKLLLSPGAEPFMPPIKGINSPNLFTLRNMADMDKIIAHISSRKLNKALVIGAGFIGLEIAENLHQKNIAVTVVEKANQVLAPVDFEIAAQVHQHMKDHGIGLYLKNGVQELTDVNDSTIAKLEDGTKLEADIVIMAIGVKPENKLALEAELEIGKTGGIKVNEYLQTSHPDIYAVGDAIEVKHYLNGHETLVPLAWPANRQGRIVADNILNKNPKPYKGSLGTSIIKAFDYTVAATGLNEKTLQQLDIEYQVATVNRNSHAGYYPGAMPFTLKLIFNSEGEILGAQGIGCDGVDKRIDVIATAIKGKLKVWDLQELELAYAPPYNSAKDPVNIAGYVAENMLNGDIETIRWFELEDYLNQNNTQLLDIRSADENELGIIPGSLHIDLDELRPRLNELNKEKEYIVYCQVGLRGYIAYRLLKQNGFRVRNLDGGYKLWHPTTLDQNNHSHIETEAANSGLCENEHALYHEERDMQKKITVNACGLQCPGPILKTKKVMEELNNGEILQIEATDPGFRKDIKTWAEKTGNILLNVKSESGVILAEIQKAEKQVNNLTTLEKDTQTVVVFSGDLDKVLASFIIANGALAMGKKVSMFFTFWGLNTLRKENFTNNKKPLLDKMFGMMMPKGASRLKLSQMHMAGMGTAMMKYVMKNKNVDSLQTLMNTFMENGGKITACTMSMDVMGMTEEELIDGIEYGGVASYLGDAQDAYSNLFI